MSRLALAILSLLAIPAAAETPLGAEAFEALTTGRTVLYSDAQQEQFLPGRRVILRLPDDQACLHGRWYAAGEAICFLYEGDPGPHCWLIDETAAGIRFRGPAGDVAYVARMTQIPLVCAQDYIGS
jgi:hypothetical protein